VNGLDTAGIDQTGSPLNTAAAPSLLPLTELPVIDPRISLGWNDNLSQLMPLSTDGHLASEGASFSFGDLGGRDTRSVDAENASIAIGLNSGHDRFGGDVPFTIAKGQTDLPPDNIAVPSLLLDAIEIPDKHSLSPFLGQTDRWVSMTPTGESTAFFDGSDRGVPIHGSAGVNTIAIASDHQLIDLTSLTGKTIGSTITGIEKSTSAANITP
jgi:hypothetical protein